jgi:PEP-CTERM motif
VQFVGAGGGLGYLNDMQIAVIPEPSAILLLMSGGTGLIFGRKRR